MVNAPKTASVSEEELAKFTAMADEWWDPHGKFKPLHLFNPIRISYIRDKVREHFNIQAQVPNANSLNGLTLLDIGCGGGLLAEPMCRLGAKVTAIDAASKNIQIASIHAEQSAIEIDYQCTTVEELAEGNNHYDIVLNMEVVEHVADVESFLSHSIGLVKPGGLMFVATLNRTAISYIKAIIGAEYVLRWLPVGTHEWKKFLKPSEIDQLMSAYGAQRKNLDGMMFNPLNSKWRVGNDVSVNYIMVFQKL